MATNVFKLKRSAVQGKVPTTAALELGELAINTYDGYIYLKKSDGVTEEIVRFGGDSYFENAVTKDSFSGDGVTTVFTLSVQPQADEYSFITINGVSQHVDAYSIVGTSLTFSEAPAIGDEIEVRTLSFKTSDVALRDYRSFTFQPSTSTSTLTGADANGVTLEYTPGKISVYLNGSKLVPTLDYTASNGTSIVLQAPVDLGDTIEIQSFATISVLDWDAIKPNSASLTTTDAGQVVDTFVAADVRTAKYIISMSHASAGYHSEEILLLHDGTNVYMTTYAQIWTTASLGSVDADISSGLVRLKVTPANINTTIKVQRITVTS